jgi:predicted double-glycine peptidase
MRNCSLLILLLVFLLMALPNTAMPWWGVSLALGRHLNMDLDQDVDAAGAFSAIEKARSLMATAPEDEKAYIERSGNDAQVLQIKTAARLDDATSLTVSSGENARSHSAQHCPRP